MKERRILLHISFTCHHKELQIRKGGKRKVGSDTRILLPSLKTARICRSLQPGDSLAVVSSFGWTTPQRYTNYLKGKKKTRRFRWTRIEGDKCCGSVNIFFSWFSIVRADDRVDSTRHHDIWCHRPLRSWIAAILSLSEGWSCRVQSFVWPALLASRLFDKECLYK